MLATTFLVFVQMCDVCPLIRAHCFSADEVAYGFLFTVDLAEGAIQVPLPVDLITVDLEEKYQQSQLSSNMRVHEMFPLHTKDEVCITFFLIIIFFSRLFLVPL